jgi:hypothetical protein
MSPPRWFLAASALASTEAFACSCALGLDEALPGDGATGVALDAHPFLLFSAQPGVVSLRDAETGDEVPSALERLTQGDQVVVRLVPEAPLEPLHAYVLDGDAGYGLAGFPITFTTGEAADLDGPEAIAVRDLDPAGIRGDEGKCGDTLYLIAKLGGAPADAFYETQVAWTEDFSEPATVSGERATQILGRGGCWDSVPELERGDEVWVRARAADLSGHAGPWSAAVHVPAVRVEGACGCASGPGGSAFAVCAALVGLARRRARQ